MLAAVMLCFAATLGSIAAVVLPDKNHTQLRHTGQKPDSQHVATGNASKAVHGLIAQASNTRSTAFATAEAQGRAAFQLGYLGGQCRCAFKGACGCDAALEFMNCIASACESGRCSCQGGQHFLYACHNMSAVCPGVGLSCSNSRSSCTATLASPTATSSTARPTEPPLLQPLVDVVAGSTAQPVQTVPKTSAQATSPLPSGPASGAATHAPTGPVYTTPVPTVTSPNTTRKFHDPPFANRKIEKQIGSKIENVVMTNRKCSYLMLLLLLSCSCFGMAGIGKDGLWLGSLLATGVPLFVLVFLFNQTDIIHRFHAGEEVGWWCSVLCVWLALQLVVGIGSIIALALKK